MTKIKDLHRRWSSDDDYKAAYDGLEGEFRLARALIAEMERDDPSARVRAIDGLEKLNAREALPRLRALLQDTRTANFGTRTRCRSR